MRKFFFFFITPVVFLHSIETVKLSTPTHKNIISKAYLWSEKGLTLEDYPWEKAKKQKISWQKLSYAPEDCLSCYVVIPKEKKPLWLFLEIENQLDSIDNWILELGYHDVPEVSIFVFEEGKLIFQNHSGTKYPFYQRMVFDRNFVYPVKIAYKSKVHIYLFLNSPFHLRFPLYISSPPAYYQKKLKEYLYFFFIFGVAFTFFVYNLAFFVRFRDRSYFFFVGYALFFALFLVQYSGFAYQYLWPAHPRFNVYVLPSLAILSCLFFTLFLQSFLSITKNPIFLKITSLLVYNYGAIIFLLMFFLAKEKIYTLTYVFTIVFIANGMMLILVGAFLKRTGVFYLVLAFSFPALVVIFTIWVIFGNLPRSFFYENLLYGSSIWKLFFLTMALSDRLARLETEKKEVENLAKERSLFFSGIAHDLRQPLNLLLGYTQELKENNFNQAQEILPKIVSSAEALQEILKDIIEYDRLETGSLRLNPEPMNIERDLFLKLYEMFYGKAQAKGLTLLFENEASQDYFADKGRILRILINLLSNAIKYTESGGVLVSFREKLGKDEVWGEFSIKDTGIGLTEEELKLIFRPYVRVGKYKKDAELGVGLGLTIVKKLVDLLHGELKVESQYGFGSTFIFKLPLKPWEEQKEASEFSSHEKNLRDLKVLIVDDDPEQVELLKLYLKKWGAESHNIFSPTEIEKLPQNFDVALLDYHVGLYDGREIAKILQEKIPTIKILFITGSESFKESDLALNVVAILTKPINFKELNLYLSEISLNKKV